MTSAVADPFACPLCRSDGTPVESIPYDEVWQSYASELGATFSNRVRVRHTPADATTLRICDSCSLQFFTPKRPGDDQFYNELMRSVTYESDRWQFAIVRRRLRGVSSLIDVGCGSGAFLRSIPVARAVGIDRNPDVHALLSDHGVEVHDDLAALAASEPDAFDAASAFEVLEHVDDVSSIMEPVRTALKPGGRLFVSVPNVDRPGGGDRRAFDLPPHHVSRWHATNGQSLADRFNMRLVRVDREPRLWGSVHSRAPALGRLLAAPAGRACLRVAGLTLKPAQAGHSLLFEFHKPSPKFR